MTRMFLFALLVAAATAASLFMSFTSVRADNESSPIFGVSVPAGYRQWELVAVAQESELDELRGILGNAVAMKAYLEGTLPFPDGAILAKLARKQRAVDRV